jgi:hypothetical protein
MMGTSQKNKNLQNRLIWVYYFIRNFIEYGKNNLSLPDPSVVLGRFPVDLLCQIVFMLYFQEQCGKVYDSYVKKIKAQS